MVQDHQSRNNLTPSRNPFHTSLLLVYDAPGISPFVYELQLSQNHCPSTNRGLRNEAFGLNVLDNRVSTDDDTSSYHISLTICLTLERVTPHAQTKACNIRDTKSLRSPRSGL
ncbi:hypothetical protein PHYBLDRAFT_153135 [Phycomyces blakesleeanus NRRL 1555(-)]|uniref:Uncharacterized protein n=1 Tax=Phycomyces blakesleeanus (strain ATCC 8743b / DSM 1359 / FGSC 10004 / NBRC 33097 / NRRL 1555) TaxID=763407 RepID=A0A162ZCT1_PHYB8|nr:hypothetical protein PHYBLDRAFT_153135 [Phycomyces blakesleeanus NRRL 1555(-)]OAD65881.1 hypothetical protein PHYBLDRAFT_153135 [Phycomyces blakesleeanus NRRL 1555(-)]|eukprot:XP_018283921.1 hypothetical protein PHYBLDRAFT_153135 [Phycomyces blakesleeanus NRRL 1555(-)]